MMTKREEREAIFKADNIKVVELYDAKGTTINDLAKQFNHGAGTIVHMLLGYWGKPSQRYRWCKHKTSKSDIEKINKLNKEGLSFEEIAKVIGTSKSAANRKANKHIEGELTNDERN